MTVQRIMQKIIDYGEECSAETRTMLSTSANLELSLPAIKQKRIGLISEIGSSLVDLAAAEEIMMCRGCWVVPSGRFWRLRMADGRDFPIEETDFATPTAALKAAEEWFKANTDGAGKAADQRPTKTSWRVLQELGLDRKIYWRYELTNALGGCLLLGFEPSESELVRKWTWERDVILEEWAKPKEQVQAELEQRLQEIAERRGAREARKGDAALPH